MEATDIRRETARLQRRFADTIASFNEAEWNTASWCEGWRMRDVLAHLVRNAEMTYRSLALDLVRGGLRPDPSASKAALRLSAAPVPELAARLRRATQRRFHLVGSTEAVGLADVLVHTADAFRPVGVNPDVAPDDIIPALDVFWTRSRVLVHAVPHKGRRLSATDLDWSRGSGPEVRGKAIDLLLLVANRRQVIPCLEGPGLVGL